MAVALNTTTRILVASEGTSNAELVRKLLEGEFGSITLSTSPESALEDYRSAQPDVLILAFQSLEKAQIYCLGLYRQASDMQTRPHRTIILCSKDDVRRAYELCRDAVFDDYVLFWPVTNDAPRLPMSVHHAVRSLKALRDNEPRAAEFAAQARRLADLGTLLERRMEQDGETVAATGSAVARTERDIGAALEEFGRRLGSSALPGVDPAHLEREIGSLREQAIAAPLRHLAESVQPLAERASEFREACAPHLESVRALRTLAERVRPTVLVVDDDPFQCKLVEKALEARNYELLFAASGSEALGLLRRLRPDLILLDVVMPGMDGLEVARRIKASSWLADVPIVMLTGVREKDTVRDALRIGVIDFVVKPFDRSTLVAKVARIVDGEA